MKIVFTRSRMPVSILIRWVLKEPVSHSAFVFDDKLVVHSDLSGVRLEWFGKFKKRVDIVEELIYDLPLEKEEEVYRSILDRFDGQPYDWGAFFYFCWRGLLHRFFGAKMPVRNPWGRKDWFLCTELASALPSWLVKVDDIDLAVTSAHGLYLELKKRKES